MSSAADPWPEEVFPAAPANPEGGPGSRPATVSARCRMSTGAGGDKDRAGVGMLQKQPRPSDHAQLHAIVGVMLCGGRARRLEPGRGAVCFTLQGVEEPRPRFVKAGKVAGDLVALPVGRLGQL